MEKIYYIWAKGSNNTVEVTANSEEEAKRKAANDGIDVSGAQEKESYLRGFRMLFGG